MLANNIRVGLDETYDIAVPVLDDLIGRYHTLGDGTFPDTGIVPNHEGLKPQESAITSSAF